MSTCTVSTHPATEHSTNCQFADVFAALQIATKIMILHFTSTLNVSHQKMILLSFEVRRNPGELWFEQAELFKQTTVPTVQFSLIIGAAFAN